MKNSEIIEFLNKNGYRLTHWEEVPMRLLKSRKKLVCIYGTCKNKPIAIFLNLGKSRVLTKDIQSLQELFNQVEKLKNITIQNRIYLYNSPICSKALSRLEELKVLHVSL